MSEDPGQDSQERDICQQLCLRQRVYKFEMSLSERCVVCNRTGAPPQPYTEEL